MDRVVDVLCVDRESLVVVSDGKAVDGSANITDGSSAWVRLKLIGGSSLEQNREITASPEKKARLETRKRGRPVSRAKVPHTRNSSAPASTLRKSSLSVAVDNSPQRGLGGQT